MGVDSGGFLLGIDVGNTVIKAVIFDLDGRRVAAHAIDGQSSTPEPGHVERDLDELWRNAREVLQRCITDSGVDPRQIIAVGCAGHGNGLYLLDRDDRALIGIQSLDTRAAGRAAELAQAHGDEFHDITLQEPWSSQTPVLLSWMRENRPEVIDLAGTVLMCKDFITFSLTGEKVSDISDMSGAGLLRMPDCSYDDNLLALYGLQGLGHLLPRLVQPTEIAGRVTAEAAALTGLAAGTPVVGGLFDVISSALGAGVVQVGETSVIAGTWSVNQYVSAEPVRNRDLLMVAAFGPSRYMVMDNSATSASHLEWYVREFVERGGHHDDPFGFCHQRIASVEPRLDDPFFHPFLYGSPQGGQHRAGFYGIAGWHGEGHLIRAVFEGVVFEHRRHIERLRAAGARIDHVTLSGGGARSTLWAQMLADCLDLPVRVSDEVETGALGAALSAGVGAGVFADYEAGILRMTRNGRVHEPETALTAHYDHRYDVSGRLATALDGFWKAAVTPRGDAATAT